MVTLMASYTVKPALQTPTGPMYISEFDQYIALSHSPTVYFYRPPPPSDDQSILFSTSTAKGIEILKDSLSKVLVLFYPLAGRLQWTNGGRLELDCNAMGALLVEAESNAKIDDLGDFCPTPEMRSFLPYVDYEKPIHELPLLLVQFTKFSCGGVSIGLGISHVVADGQCAGYFVSEWARIARGEQPEHFPFLDRTVLRTLDGPLPAPRFDHPEFSPRTLIIGRTSDLEERKKETTVAMLKLTKEQIQKLRNKANDGNTGGEDRAFTKFEAVAAHVWRCASKARKHQSEQLTTMFCHVNFRGLLDPPLSKWYFGNAVLIVTAIATAGELLEKPFVYATRKVREAIKKVTHDYIRSALNFLGNEPDLSKFRHFHFLGSTIGAFKGNPNITVNSWTSLPLYNADFGWGNEIHFGPAVLGQDGKAFVLPDRNQEGSFIIPLRLQVEHMDAFKKFFYEDI